MAHRTKSVPFLSRAAARRRTTEPDGGRQSGIRVVPILRVTGSYPSAGNWDRANGLGARVVPQEWVLKSCEQTGCPDRANRLDNWVVLTGRIA